MARVVFLRGVNVGGHKSFRPSVVARKLSDYGVVNVGAAGTFVVWKPGPVAKFRADLLRMLPFEAAVTICEGSDVIGLSADNPFATEGARDVTRFVSVLMEPGRVQPSMPVAFPSEGEWLVRLIGCKGKFVFGEYRRTMKTIGYLSQIDKVFGVKVTTRNWNTIMAVARVLKAGYV